MNKIIRNPSDASKETYDLIIIGGGIYGVMLSFVASQFGLKNLLVERDDFGGATSYNSLRIVHGGLRYLQKADLHRFLESVNERRWFLRNFPGLVEPLPCLMPLYGIGIYRPSVFRPALMLNDILSMHRNEGVHRDYHLHSGRIVSRQETEEIFPGIDRQGLKGGAVWYDASMPDSQLLLIAILKQSCWMKTTALNYVEAVELLRSNDGVEGLVAIDRENSRTYHFSSKIVINCAGPWCRELAAGMDRDYPELFKSSIAWNVLFDRKALSDYALAITPKRPGARTYFLRPWKGMLLAGTVHEPWDGVESNPMPSTESVTQFIDDLNQSIPNLDLTHEEILHIFSGLLPAKREGSTELAVREVILDHGKTGGLKGLFSISGVKFTTARLVAEKAVRKIFPDLQVPPNDRPIKGDVDESTLRRAGIFNFEWRLNGPSHHWKDDLKKIIAEESVLHLDDLILRRTTLGDNPARALAVAPAICELFEWDTFRCEQELARLRKYFEDTIPSGILKGRFEGELTVGR